MASTSQLAVWGLSGRCASGSGKTMQIARSPGTRSSGEPPETTPLKISQVLINAVLTLHYTSCVGSRYGDCPSGSGTLCLRSRK